MKACDPRGAALLELAAAGDEELLREYRRRVSAGEPAPYVAGFILFRGRKFSVDRRAYITDPELTSLVDVVASEGAELERRLGRPLCVLEFGVGAGTLAISLKLEHPRWSLCGVDLDAGALKVARENARRHDVPLDLRESDYFSAWEGEAVFPDLVFGDPPWGGEGDLYADDRDENYYRQMPEKSAFPGALGRCGIHDGIIDRMIAMKWTSLLVLNYGVLPPELIEVSTVPLAERRVVTCEGGMRVLVGRAVSV